MPACDPAEALTALQEGEVALPKSGGFAAEELRRLVALLTKGILPHYAKGGTTT